MQRLALNSGQQQQQQEGTGSIGPSSGNPTQYREQVSYNQHTGPLGPTPPPSSNLSNWNRRASRCSRVKPDVYESHFSLHSNHSRRLLAAAIHVQQNASSCGAAHAPLCPLSFGTMCRNLGSNRSIRRAEPRHRYNHARLHEGQCTTRHSRFQATEATRID